MLDIIAFAAGKAFGGCLVNSIQGKIELELAELREAVDPLFIEVSAISIDRDSMDHPHLLQVGKELLQRSIEKWFTLHADMGLYFFSHKRDELLKLFQKIVFLNHKIMLFGRKAFGDRTIDTV